ncbi:hypothetical protein LINPERPRIM_LOCUS34256, partial [Linum perenne]
YTISTSLQCSFWVSHYSFNSNAVVDSILARLVRNTKPADEFEYDVHEINCYCGVRSSRRISRDPPTMGIKYFGCGNDHKGCGYFIWFEDKVVAMDDKVALIGALNDKIALMSAVDLLESNNRGLSDENRDLQSTLSQVRTVGQVHDEGSSTNIPECVYEDQLKQLSDRVSRVENFIDSLQK